MTLRVANSGAPIPADRLTLIFQPFVRGGSRVDGFGLGLAFARAVARSHAGDVELQTTGERTEVILRLPALRLA